MLSRPHPVFGDWCYCQPGDSQRLLDRVPLFKHRSDGCQTGLLKTVSQIASYSTLLPEPLAKTTAITTLTETNMTSDTTTTTILASNNTTIPTTSPLSTSTAISSFLKTNINRYYRNIFPFSGQIFNHYY